MNPLRLVMLSPCFATAAAPGLSAAEFGPASLAGFRAIMHRGGAGVPRIRKFFASLRLVLPPGTCPSYPTLCWSCPLMLWVVRCIRTSMVVSRSSRVAKLSTHTVHDGPFTPHTSRLGQPIGNGLGYADTCRSFLDRAHNSQSDRPVGCDLKEDIVRLEVFHGLFS